MAPKRKAAEVPVKQETAESSLCVNNKSGKTLTNAVQYRLRSAPTWLKEYYAGKVRYGKHLTTEQKQQFLQNLLDDKTFESDFFEQLKSTEHSYSDKSTKTWISWKKVCENEDPDVARLMVKQGSLLSRPHKDLDHSTEAVKALEWEKRHQFAYVTELEETCTTESKKISVADQKDADDAERTGEPEPQQAHLVVESPAKQQRLLMTASRNCFLRMEADLDGRLLSYKDNEYVAKSYTETAKTMTSLKKQANKLKTYIIDATAAEDGTVEDGQLADWKAATDKFSEDVKVVKHRIGSMKQFVTKQAM